MKNNKTKKIIFIFVLVFLLFGNYMIVFAADTVALTPADNQCLELRAVEIKDVDGQNKQVIMQLWGNNLVFKRI